MKWCVLEQHHMFLFLSMFKDSTTLLRRYDSDRIGRIQQIQQLEQAPALGAVIFQIISVNSSHQIYISP